EEDGRHSADSAGHLPAEKGSQHKTEDGDEKGPAEIAERGCMGNRLAHGRTSQPEILFADRYGTEKRGIPQRACGQGMVSFFIERKSAGLFAGGTDITRAP